MLTKKWNLRFINDSFLNVLNYDKHLNKNFNYYKILTKMHNVMNRVSIINMIESILRDQRV